MEYEALRRRVCAANLQLPAYGLVTFTWGNASEVDRATGVFAIKPSGVTYETLKPEDIVILDLNGNVVDGTLNPSSDTKTHLALYRAFPEIGGVVHTHSRHATAWAQTAQDLPCFGTTHADAFHGAVPCTRFLTAAETEADYEGSTGLSIVERFRELGLSPAEMPGVLCAGHGPFSWGGDAAAAAKNAAILEEVAAMAALTVQIRPDAGPLPLHYLEKHYSRKHGPNATYGQKSR